MSSDDSLRQRLFAAAEAENETELAELCREYRESVVARFPAWRRVPEGLVEAPQALEAYAQGLYAVASCFEEALGDSQLLDLLTGEERVEQNPLRLWEDGLTRARAFREALEFREAIECLTDLLIDSRKLRGSAVGFYRPLTYGLLGDCYLQAGDSGAAIRPSEHALAGARANEDKTGERAFLEQLYEIHRYRGEREAAIVGAEALAELSEGNTRTWFEAQARLHREGFPRNRVVAEVSGQRYELSDLPTDTTGRLRLVFARDRMALLASQEWTRRGEAAGEAGDFEGALLAFRRAWQADPRDPHPRYQAAVTLLHLERFDEAVDHYLRVEALAPAWFHVRSNLWFAERLAAGELASEALSSLRRLEDGSLSPQGALELVERARVQAKVSFPALDLHQARAELSLGRREDAEVTLRSALRETQEVDLRTRLLLELGLLLEGRDKREVLWEAVDLDGNLVAAATARLVLTRTGPGSIAAG